MHVCFFLYTVQRENERHVLAPSRRIEAPVSSTGKKSDTDPVADARQSPETAPAASRPAGVIPALPVRPAWRPSSTRAPTRPPPAAAGGGSLAENNPAGGGGGQLLVQRPSGAPMRAHACPVCPPPSNHSLRSDPIRSDPPIADACHGRSRSTFGRSMSRD